VVANEMIILGNRVGHDDHPLHNHDSLGADVDEVEKY
jgi:hypothetical protein